MIKTKDLKEGLVFFRDAQKNSNLDRVANTDTEYKVIMLLSDPITFVEEIIDYNSLMPYREELKSRTYCLCERVSDGQKIRLEVISSNSIKERKKTIPIKNQENHIYNRDKPVILYGIEQKDNFIKLNGNTIL